VVPALQVDVAGFVSASPPDMWVTGGAL